MTFEPGDRAVEQCLIAGRIRDQRATDPSKPPDDQRCERQHHRDGQRHSDRQRDQRWNALLQQRLERPYQRDDEQTEGQRRQHDADIVGRNRDRRGGDQRDPGFYRRLGLHQGHSQLTAPGDECGPGGMCPKVAAVYSLPLTTAALAKRRANSALVRRPRMGHADGATHVHRGTAAWPGSSNTSSSFSSWRSQR